MRRKLVLYCATAIAVAAPTLFSASAAFAAADQKPPTATVDEIVVTAMKRGENLQDVAASVSALSAETLKDRGVSDVKDIAKLVPNVNWGEHFGSALVTIRGVGSTVDSGITEPTVAMYADGVFLPRSTMPSVRAIDLDRVEVLRGPQGTLYGRNATGGAINFVSQAPSRTFEGMANVSTGSRSAFGVSGYVSGPLADGVYGRLSGGHDEQDGYVKISPSGKTLGGADINYVRGALRLEPSSGLTIDLAARYEENKAANGWQQLFTPALIPTAGQTLEPNRIVADQPFAQNSKTTVLSSTVNWTISDKVSLRSITSYVDHKSKVSVDADSTILDGFNTIDFTRPSKSYAQEFNLLGAGDKVQWILGLYYYHEKAGNALPLRLGTFFAPGFGVPANTVLTASVDSKTESLAAFADVTYSFSERMRLNLGLRYNHETKDFLQNRIVSIPGVGVVPGSAAYAAGPIAVGTTSSKLLPKINLQFDLTDNVNSYVQYSKGFKSGGENLEGGDGGAVGALGLYRPEGIDAYEVGLKSRLFDRRVIANFAAFYYDYSGLQVTITKPPTTTVVQNADAKIYGLEGEFSWSLTESLKLDGSATLTHARFNGFSGYDDAQPSLGVQNLDGKPLPHAPDFTARLGGEYRIDLGEGFLSTLTVRGDVSYSDDVVLRYFGTANDTQKAYWLSSVSAKLSDANRLTELRLYVNNLGDKIYKQNVTYIGAIGAYMGNYAAPRTWGVQLSRKF
ncbi:TonB-dependent receptor [Caulobacter sp. SSI4214]|uniref:TonB-dependent receptor n=1 Tax=Caulobacter sp. SSI4214 TaxID=2575739 RepID=UPI00143A6E3C|nr:TonB-dependent receptor [Caulobacter sp. SSI4214]